MFYWANHLVGLEHRWHSAYLQNQWKKGQFPGVFSSSVFGQLHSLPRQRKDEGWIPSSQDGLQKVSCIVFLHELMTAELNRLLVLPSKPAMTSGQLRGPPLTMPASSLPISTRLIPHSPHLNSTKSSLACATLSPLFYTIKIPLTFSLRASIISPNLHLFASLLKALSPLINGIIWIHC